MAKANSVRILVRPRSIPNINMTSTEKCEEITVRLHSIMSETTLANIYINKQILALLSTTKLMPNPVMHST